MARKKPEHPPVHRTDLLPFNLTAAKRAKVLDLLAHYRAGAVTAVAARQQEVGRGEEQGEMAWRAGITPFVMQD